jgi:hypothetical protein
MERRHGIAMMMVEGTPETVAVLQNSASVNAHVDESEQIVEDIARHEVEVGKDGKALMPGMGVKRRYWFESMGVPIGNLIVL